MAVPDSQIVGGKQLLNMVVANDDVATRCIDHLRKRKLGTTRCARLRPDGALSVRAWFFTCCVLCWTWRRSGRLTFVPLCRISNKPVVYPVSDDCSPLISNIRFEEKFRPAVAQVRRRAGVQRHPMPLWGSVMVIPA